MALAALLGGQPLHASKSAAAHACSLPLSLPGICRTDGHALTLDHFIRFNGPAIASGCAPGAGGGLRRYGELIDRVAALKPTRACPQLLRSA